MQMIGGSEGSEGASLALRALERKNVLALLAESPYASLVLDATGTIVYCSKAWLDLLHESREAMVGLRLEAVVGLDDSRGDWAALRAGQLRAGDVWARRSGGDRMALHLSRCPVFDAAGDLVAVVCQAAARSAEIDAVRALQTAEARSRAFVAGSSDIAVVFDTDGTIPYVTPSPEAQQIQALLREISEYKAEVARLTLWALTDPLTGLANRSLLQDRLERALFRLSRHEGTVAVMFLDVDRFKIVNDELGHDAGDEMLVAIGERIRRSIRTTDTVARYGGDEFVVVAEDIRFHDEPVSVAERMIAAVSEPLELAGVLVTPSISVGIASTASSGRTPDDLVRDADIAMYKAKEHGGGSFALFNEAMRRGARRRPEAEDALDPASVEPRRSAAS
jgi:diguanylate cyclase (GGDEF)-like protein